MNKAACLADGVPILRRASGGGTVLLGKGCLCYSLVLSCDHAPALWGIRSSYIYILERIRDALSDILPGIACAGTSDLAVGGRKFSGNAQQRKRGFLLHHADKVFGQLCRYMGFIKREVANGQPVRGIIVGRDIDQKLQYAVEAVPKGLVTLKAFDFRLSIRDRGLSI